MAVAQFLLYITSVVFGFFVCNGTHFEYSWHGEYPCMMVDINAVFNVSMKYGMMENVRFPLTGAIVYDGCGSSNSADLNILLFNTGDEFRFLFRGDENLRNTSLTYSLLFMPWMHFENVRDGAIEFISDAIPTGFKNMRYVCRSQQIIYFNEDVRYSMTMEIDFILARALYEDFCYREEYECQEDKMTTSVYPSPFVSDTMKQEFTSNIPDPGTTTFEFVNMLSTTPDCFPKYLIIDGDTICIIFQANIRFNINYERSDNQVAVQSISVPTDARADGQCAVDGDNTTQNFTLNFFKGKWSFSVQISEDEQTLLGKPLIRAQGATPSYSWNSVQLTYVIDAVHFENPKISDIGQIKTVLKEDMEGVFSANVGGSYKCSSKGNLQLSEDVLMELDDFQYRAFGLDSFDNFADWDVTECSLGGNGHNPSTILMYIAIASGAVVILVSASVILYCKVKRKNTSLRQASTISRSEFDTTILCESNDKTIPTPSHANTSHRRVGVNEVSGRRIFVNGKISSSVKISRQGTSPTASSNLDQRNDEREPLLKLL